MRPFNLIGLLSALLLVSAAGLANASPIEMSPNPATVNAVMGNDFSLILESGDSDTNVLDFRIQGTGGHSVAVAAIVFDGASVISASDTTSGFFNSSNVVRGLIMPQGAVAGLLIDFGAPNSEAFSLTLSATPTTATLYALNLDNLGEIRSHDDIRANILDSTELRFRTIGTPSAPMPEPSAALVFATGLLIAQSRIRRR